MKLELLLLLCVLASGCISLEVEKDAQVTEVIDGDTLKAEFDGRKETVRLNGIDAPETNVANDPSEFEGVPDSEAGRKCLKSWGVDATDYLESKVSGENVKLEYSRLPFQKRGDYGRLLGTIYLDGTDLNRELVRKGFARSYREDGVYFEEEVSAKLNVSGVWSCQGVS